MSIEVQWQILPIEHLGLAAIRSFYSRSHSLCHYNFFISIHSLYVLQNKICFCFLIELYSIRYII
uniref:Uncharacterized protein n=1 Tax=Populus trichocarpa TaxID=3694 RepID=A0A2K1WNG1_POPTR